MKKLKSNEKLRLYVDLYADTYFYNLSCHMKADKPVNQTIGSDLKGHRVVGAFHYL